MSFTRVGLIIATIIVLILHVESQTYTCSPIDWNSRTSQTGCSKDNLATYQPSPSIVSKQCNLNIPSSLVTDLAPIFPSGKTPNAALLGPSIYATINQPKTNITVTYLLVGAGYTNQIGYFNYSFATGERGPYNLIFPRVNNNNGGCLKRGDTFTVGPFNSGEVIGFFLFSNGYGSSTKTTYHSFIDPPSLTNPDASCAPNGCKHTAWVEMSDYNLKVFGFEDQSMGDADYNDIMFTFEVEGGADLIDIPDYGGGTIKTCNQLPSVSSSSYAELNCTQWALLESSASQACLSYFTIPTGWTWAPNDATSRAAISALASQWGYTGASCFLLSTTATSGVGYHPNGTQCDANEWRMDTFQSAGKTCYNSVCTSRFVLKGQYLQDSCGSVGGSCSATNAGEVLTRNPSAAAGIDAPVLPFAYSVYVKAPGGSVSLSTDVKLPASGQVLLDSVILLDTNGMDSNAKNQIIASAANVYTYFANNGFLPNTNTTYGVGLGFALYNPTSASSYYISYPTSLVYTKEALISQLASWNPNGAAPQSSTKIPEAVAAIMNGNSINWRSDAFRSIWVISANNWVSDSSLGAASRANSIVPVFEYPSGNSIPRSWTTALNDANLPFIRTFLGSGSNSNPFANVFLSSSSKSAGYFASQVVNQVLALSGSGDTQFLGSLPAVKSASLGTTTNIPYTISWPTGLAVNNSVTGYATSVTIYGRRSTSISINFNHPPSSSNFAATVSGNSFRTLTFSGFDPDGNTLTWKLTSTPSLGGKIYRTTDDSEITVGQTNVPGSLTVKYVPQIYIDGVETFTFEVSDGCSSVSQTATITVTPTNSPPQAENIVITIKEDSLWNEPLDNGLINFAPYISDPDNTFGGKNQALSVRLNSFPLPSAKGSLYAYPSTPAPSTLLSLGNIANTTRFVTNFGSGFGNVTFTYVASDGALVSSPATVTIVIEKINHAPVLTLASTTISSDSGKTNVPILATITDIDLGDSVNLKVLASGLTVQSVASTDQTFAAATSPSGFSFYNNNRTSGTTSFPLSDLVWPIVVGTGQVEWIDLYAIDNSGAVSNTVRLNLLVSDSVPPTWVTSTQRSFTVQQGVSMSDINFAATDSDVDEWKTLIFNITVLPSYGTLEILPSGPGSARSIVVGDNFANGDGYVVLDNTRLSSNFSVKYIPNPTYWGSDSFAFVVRDIRKAYAATDSRVDFTILRNNTPPDSASISVTTLEETSASFSIPLSSTNGDSVEVQLVMDSINFIGTVTLPDGVTPWNPNVSTDLTQSGSLTFTLLPSIGVYSEPENTPVGNFTYHVYEPFSGLSSAQFVCQIYVIHVNHPPASVDQRHTIQKREVLELQLPATDKDRNDPTPTLRVQFRTLPTTNKGAFFMDKELTTPLQLNTNLVNRTFWYVSNSDFSWPSTTPLARYTFFVLDNANEPSPTYNGDIYVNPAGDPPVYSGPLDQYTYQETPLPMSLGTSITTETGTDNITINIISMPEKGNFSVCNDVGVCTQITKADLPALVPSAAGRVVFVPRAYDWGMNFTSFEFQIVDGVTNAVANYTMLIHVYHVNKRPNIYAANFLTTAQSNAGIVLNESSSTVLNWYVNDPDSLPSTLSTSIRVTFYTSQGFSLYTCTFESSKSYNTSSCVFNPAVPFGERADFRANARKSVQAYEVANSACSDAEMLKERYGNTSVDCEARFKLAFVPTPLSSFTPYIAISFTAIDDEDAQSTSITALLFVKAINNPPTIWSPPLVVAAQGNTNPFIRDTTSSSPTFNQPVSVEDIDNGGAIEQLTITCTEGSGNLVWPADAPCQVDSTTPKQWICLDRIPNFNSWLVDLRFNVSSGTDATLRFVINDLGNSGDYTPSPNLTASSTTSVRVVPFAASPPRGNTLAIAVGVAAGAGLLLLGALGFFLRKSVAPPEDDYFAAATTPLSAAPTSPLYAPQNQESFSPLYKEK